MKQVTIIQSFEEWVSESGPGTAARLFVLDARAGTEARYAEWYRTFDAAPPGSLVLLLNSAGLGDLPVSWLFSMLSLPCYGHDGERLLLVDGEHGGSAAIARLRQQLKAQGMSDVIIRTLADQNAGNSGNLDTDKLRSQLHDCSAALYATQRRLVAAETELANQQDYLRVLRNGHEAREIQQFYNERYEALPRWYLKLGGLIRRMRGKGGPPK